MNIEKLKHYYKSDIKLNDDNKLEISNYIEELLNDIYIDLGNLEKFGIFIYYKESMIDLISDEIIDNLYGRDIDRCSYLINKIKENINLDNELFIKINNEVKPFYIKDHVELIWNNKKLMNYLLKL